MNKQCIVYEEITVCILLHNLLILNGPEIETPTEFCVIMLKI